MSPFLKSLSQLNEELEQNPKDLRAFIVQQGDQILLEKYLNGYTFQDKQHLYSCSKSITGLIAGIALEQEGYDLIHTPLCQFFPEYDWSGDERKMKMTFEHILTMTSGLKWQEAGRPWGPGNTNWEMEHSANWLDFVLNIPSSSEGGKRFSYATGISHLILAIVEKITQKSAIDFAEENLFKPLEIEAHWDLDPQGFPQGGKGLYLKPRDLLKIGRAIHRGGREGENQVIPQRWIEETFIPRTRGHIYYGQYGYHWWLKTLPEGPLSLNGEPNVHCAIGFGGQFLYMVPEWDLTCVITGHMVGAENFEHPQNLFKNFVLKAYKDSI